MSKRLLATCLLLLMILGIGAGLRFYRISYSGFGVDEDSTVQTAWELSRGLEPSAPDIQGYYYLMPVSYYLTAASVRVFGLNYLGFRLPFFLLGILSLLLLYGFTRAVTGEDHVALLATFFLAISATQIKYAQTARYIMPTIVMAIAIAWMFLSFLRTMEYKRGVAVIGLLALGIFNNLFLALLLPLGWVYFAAVVLWPSFMSFEKRPRLAVPFLVVTSVAGLVLLYFMHPFVMAWWDQSVQYIQQAPELRFSRSVRFFGSTIFRIGGLIFLMAIAGTGWMIHADRRREGWLVALFGLAPTFLLFGLSLFAYARSRYVIFTAAFCCLAASYLLVRLWRRGGWAGPVTAVVLFLLTSTALLWDTTRYLNTGDGRIGQTEAYRTIRENFQSGDQVAITAISRIAPKLHRVPVPDGDVIPLVLEYGRWLDRHKDRRVWVMRHGSFDPAYQMITLTDEERCRHFRKVDASTRFTKQWYDIFLCEAQTQ